MLLRAGGFVIPGGAAGTAFEQVASSSDDTIAVTDPRDFAVTIPPGTGRVILDFIGYASDFSTAFVDSDIIDPGGGQQVALTEAEERKEPSGSAAAIKLYYLLDTNMPTGPTETLRYDQDNAAGNAAKWGPRQIITVHGAAQTVHHSGNQHDANANLVVTCARTGGGNFATGSLVWVGLMSEGTGAYTVTGHATEVRDIQVSTNRRFVFAHGTLGAGVAIASVTFATISATLQKAAAIAVLEPA